jgi:hypothetical protein
MAGYFHLEQTSRKSVRKRHDGNVTYINDKSTILLPCLPGQDRRVMGGNALREPDRAALALQQACARAPGP